MNRSDSVGIEMIYRARGGDGGALEEICTLKKGLVTAIARKYFIVGGDLDDLLQEGMIGLYKAILAYDPEKNDCFDAFVAICVHRQILDAVRAANRDKNKPLSEGIALDDVLNAAGGPMPEEEFFKNEQKDAYLKARQDLSEFEREVLDAFMRGESYRDIAKMFGVDVKKIDNTLQRAKTRMRAKLTEFS